MRANPYKLLVGILITTTIIETVWSGPKNLEIELRCDVTIPVLGIYPKEISKLKR
jgi:hypothetical protein